MNTDSKSEDSHDFEQKNENHDEHHITRLDPESDFVNPKVMENWVDDILKDAEILGLERKFFK